jgi:hypothetical protein
MLLLAAAAAMNSAQPLQSGTPAYCPRTTSYYAYRSSEPLKPRKPTELPPANAYAAVYRHIGRCEAPIVVKYGVGNR